MKKASDLFVEALENEGAEYIFGIPGEENLDLLESLSDSSIRLILTRHEQAAGFMAATYGRLTGKPGVALSTLGPGATNLMTAAAFADLGAMPMVMVTGQKPIRSSKQGQFQIIDVVDMMQPVTKFSHQLDSADWIPSMIREAFRNASEERLGPSHLELPEDIAQEETEVEVLAPSFVRRPVAEDKSIDEAVRILQKAKRPLLLVGAGANRKQTCHRLRDLVERTGMHFVTTQMGKGVISESDERFVGNAALSSGDFVHEAIERADVILNVGHDVVEKPPFFMKPEGRTVIHVNYTSARVDPVYFPQAEIVGDIADSIRRLNEELGTELPQWETDVFETVQKAIAEHRQERANPDHFPLLPRQLVDEVREAMPDKGIIALDNGIYKIWFARNYPAYSPNTVLLDNALATMGAGLPAAMAAKLVHPDRRVMAVCGDGGFFMNSAELETAVRLGLDLVVTILRDDAYGMIKWKQENMGFDDYGLDFGNADLVSYAQSYGATGHRVEKSGQFLSLVQSAFENGGVHVIDVPVDYSENDRILNHELKERSAALFE